MFHCYILQSNDGSDIYIGSTSNLERRLKQHKEGKCYSTRRKKWHLLYYESYLAEEDARIREKRLKYYGKGLAMLKKRIKHSLDKFKGCGV